jgi:hypothetical protein
MRSNPCCVVRGFTRVSIHLHERYFAKKMDRRGKSGDDAGDGAAQSISKQRHIAATMRINVAASCTITA